MAAVALVAPLPRQVKPFPGETTESYPGRFASFHTHFDSARRHAINGFLNVHGFR